MSFSFIIICPSSQIVTLSQLIYNKRKQNHLLYFMYSWRKLIIQFLRNWWQSVFFIEVGSQPSYDIDLFIVARLKFDLCCHRCFTTIVISLYVDTCLNSIFSSWQFEVSCMELFHHKAVLIQGHSLPFMSSLKQSKNLFFYVPQEGLWLFFRCPSPI